MKLTQKLLSYLPRAFEKSSGEQLALRLRYDGVMTWTIADGMLTTAVTGGTGTAQSVDLSAYTVATLAAHMAALPGYTVPYQDGSEFAALSALVLLDGTGNEDQSNGDHLYGYTSNLWAYLEAQASALKQLREQISQMLLQMSTATASGEWLDEIGSYYAAPRAAGEGDPAYSGRISAEVIKPRGNNVAMAAGIQAYIPSATRVRVIDTVIDNQYPSRHDGATTHNGALMHNSGLGAFAYGYFDVDFSYAFTSPISQADYINMIVAASDAYRDAGLFLRVIVLRNLTSTTTITAQYNVGSVRIVVINDF